MSVGFGLSPHPLVFGLSGSGFGDHSLQLSPFEIGFIWLRPLEDSTEQE